MKGNLTKAAGLFQAPLSQVARLAAALQEKKEAAEGACRDPAADDTTAPAADALLLTPPTDTDRCCRGHRGQHRLTPRRHHGQAFA